MLFLLLLQVIACVGETLDQRQNGNLWNTLDRQMQALFEEVRDWSRVVIAYEPVWAIGTGQVSTVCPGGRGVTDWSRVVIAYEPVWAIGTGQVSTVCPGGGGASP